VERSNAAFNSLFKQLREMLGVGAAQWEATAPERETRNPGDDGLGQQPETNVCEHAAIARNIVTTLAATKRRR
jgi:hypothetical protein